jgi:hypothetical protein
MRNTITLPLALSLLTAAFANYSLAQSGPTSGAEEHAVSRAASTGPSARQSASTPATDDPLKLGETDLMEAVAVPAGDPPEQCVNKMREADDNFKATGKDDAIRKLFDFKGNQLCMTYLVMSSDQYSKAISGARSQLRTIHEAQVALLLHIAKEVKAVSQQEGSSAGSGGSTNLASKGIAAKFLSLASEYGALTQSTSNMTTTVQGTLAGLPVVLLKKGLAEDCSTKLLALTPCFHHDVLNWLNRISYSVSFDSSQTGQSLNGTASGQAIVNAQPANFTANNHTINAVSAKFIARRGGTADPTAFENAFTAFANANPGASPRALADFFDLRQEANLAAFQNWLNGAVTVFERGMGSELANHPAAKDLAHISALNAWKTLATDYVEEGLGLSKDVSAKDAAGKAEMINAAKFAVAYVEYLGKEEEATLSLAKPPELTFEYDENRPAGQPTNSVFRAIYQHKFAKPQVLPKIFTGLTMTANGAFSIYDSDPSAAIPGASRLRDIQAAVQADHDIQIKSAILGNIGMTLTGAYYFQHQSSPAILNVDPTNPVPGVTFTGLPATATQVFAEKGNISIGQLKLSVGSGSNIKVPISVTYANRTELITKPTWRGQIGISYDFDSLFAAVK